MRNLWIIFRFEFKSLIEKKSIIVGTLIIGLLMLVGTSIPTIMTFFDSKEEVPTVPEQVALIEHAAYYMEDTSIMKDVFFPFLQEANPIIFASEDELKQAIQDSTYKYGFVVHSPSSYTMIVRDKDSYDSSDYVFSAALQGYQKDQNLKSMGIDPMQVYQATNVNVSGNTVILGKDSSQGIILAYGFMIVVYMLILLYGSIVSTAVAREKDSRTMELLITSTSPKDLMLGKVLSSALMGCLQVAIIILVTVIGFQLNKSNYPVELIGMLAGYMPLETIAIFILFMVSGYLLYLFIYAALGSLVSKVEDVSSAIMPVTFLFVIAYLLASIAINAPNTLVTKVSSFVPFVSLFTMPIRYMLVSVSAFEVGISLVLMLVTTYLIARLSIYIYRAGSLNYGNKMSMVKLIKDFKKKQ